MHLKFAFYCTIENFEKFFLFLISLDNPNNTSQWGKNKNPKTMVYLCVYGLPTYPKYTLLLLLKPKMTNQIGVTINYS
jgi:hypothetical protein